MDTPIPDEGKQPSKLKWIIATAIVVMVIASVVVVVYEEQQNKGPAQVSFYTWWATEGKIAVNKEYAAYPENANTMNTSYDHSHNINLIAMPFPRPRKPSLSSLWSQGCFPSGLRKKWTSGTAVQFQSCWPGNRKDLRQKAGKPICCSFRTR